MKLPWKLVQQPEWPFRIHISNADNETILCQDRFAYSTASKTIDDVMDARGFTFGKDRENAIIENERQLKTLQHIVDCVNNGESK